MTELFQKLMSQAMQKLAQRKFIKGVVASAQDFAQPQGSVPRASNWLLTRRGALITCDGSQLITTPRLTVFPPHPPAPGVDNLGPLTEIFLFEPIGLDNAYYAIFKDQNTGLVGTTALAAVDGGAGGNLSAGTYQWVITALDGAGGETGGSNILTLVLAANHKANLTWTAVTFATGYNVYRTVANGSVFLLVNGATPVTTTAYPDNTADANLGVQIPGSDTTQTSKFLKLTTPDYSFIGPIANLPADALPLKDGTGGGGGGGFGGGTGPSIGGGTSGAKPPTPAGGVSGNISPIPQIVQFTNKMILALGNGYPPQSSDGNSMSALLNTFTATYPAHATSNPQAKGDLITVTVGGTPYVYKAIQGGTTAAAAPAFPAGINVTVADGSVIWQNIGIVGSNPAPRGAAHAIVYAGSLWIFNTSPDNTTDNFDGPSCLKMSDTNNPNSWNPLNVAFLDKDDGSQGMGLAVFTIAESGIAPTGSLVAFKEFSTFQIIGIFGAADFAIQRAQTDMGCVAPRTIQFVPGFGIVRLTHLGFGVFDGTRDRLISEEIRPYIFGDLQDVSAADWNYIWFAKACLTADPPMYCCAIPVIPSTTIKHLNVTNIGASLGGPGIAPGNYWAIYFLQDTQGNYWRSDEFGPITLDAAHRGFQVTLFGGPPVYRSYIWYGTSSGGEDTVAILPGNFISTPTIGTKSGLPFTSSGMLFRLLCYDLVLKAWIIVDLPFAISAMKQFRSVGTIPITVMSGFSDGSLRRWQMGDPQWDVGATVAGASDLLIHHSVTSAEVYGKNASDRVFFRRLTIRGVGDPTGMSATFVSNGLSGQPSSTQNFTVALLGNSQFVAYVDIALTAMNVHMKLNGSAAAPFEIDSFDWSYMPKPVAGMVVAG